MNARMHKEKQERMNERMDERKNKRTNEQTNKCKIEEQMNAHANE